MNKKAVFMGLMADIWGWTILFLGILFWIMIYMLFSNNIAYELTGESAYLNDNAQIITFLKTPVGNRNLADIITLAYETKQDSEVKPALNQVLNSIYGRAKPVCWTLWYYENDKKQLLSEEQCKNKKNIFDARTIIPLHNVGTLDIRLTVLGYTK